MSEYVCLLIETYVDRQIFKYGLKIKYTDLPADCVEYWREDENSAALVAALELDPDTPIVGVRSIWEVVCR